jgi:succinate dehydrogenase / fumarate reductase cytochrome b subunit
MPHPDRPVFLNLLQLHLPITAWVSILHRISGALLGVSLPFLVWGFARALHSAAGFAQVAAVISSLWVKLILLVLAWLFAHHFFAGLRHLAMDADIGLDLADARSSSRAVFAAGAIVAAGLAWALFA